MEVEQEVGRVGQLNFCDDLFSIVNILLILCGDIEVNPGPKLRDTPTLQLLNCFKYSDHQQHHKIFIIDNVASNWKRLGLALNISDYHLDNIELSSHRNVEDWCLTMLSHWLRGTAGDGPVTWEALLEAMEDARCGQLAQQVKRALQYEADLALHSASPQLQLDSSQSPHLTYQARDSTSTSNPLITYQEYLKDLYKEEYPDYSKPQLTRHRPKQIINLVLIDRVGDESDKLQQECLLYQLQGNVDLIQQTKNSLTIDQIETLFSGSAAHRVLIEGAPGIGKTTLLWQLCHQWADGKLLQQWELVLLVQLRDETTRTTQCLFDLLYHPHQSIREAICKQIEEKEGENVLLIFDGYDEVSDDQYTDSIFLKIMQKSVLRKATVVVSSRPGFAIEALPHQFKNKVDRHVEIIGFNEQDIDKYLTSACESNADMLRDLKFYISARPFISSVLYNPLHCTIVTELYLQYWQRGEKGFAPSTLTQLYQALVLNLLRRHFGFDATPSWNNLQSDVSYQLNQLAELAARGIERKRYIFDNVPSNTFGLMHSFKHLHDIRPNHPTSHSFTHLTIQEFLAAYYWSKLPPQQLKELLLRRNLFPIEDYLEGEHMTPLKATCHWPVLLFLAGLSQLDKVLEQISPWAGQKISQADSFTFDARIKFHPSLCQLLFEAQSPELVRNVFHKRKVHPVYDKMKINPLDWFAIGYCIAHSDTTSSWVVVFGNILSTSHPQCLQALSSGLHYSSSSTHNSTGGEIGPLTELTLHSGIHVSPYLKIFPSLFPYTKAITELWLAGELSKDDKGVTVLQNISDYCPQLRELAVPCLSSPTTSLVRPHPTLDTLYIMLPHTEDDSVLCHHLEQCPALKHLILWPLDENTDIFSSLAAISPLFTSPLFTAHIEHLELKYVSINNSCIKTLVNSLSSPLSSLCKLGLSSCLITNNDYCQLTAGIATSNLTHFKTDNLKTDVIAAEGLAIALKQSQTLEEVEVKESPISIDVVQVLAQAMNNSTVKKLVMERVIKDTVLSDCSYPTDRVKILY